MWAEQVHLCACGSKVNPHPRKIIKSGGEKRIVCLLREVGWTVAILDLASIADLIDLVTS